MSFPHFPPIHRIQFGGTDGRLGTQETSWFQHLRCSALITIGVIADLHSKIGRVLPLQTTQSCISWQTIYIESLDELTEEKKSLPLHAHMVNNCKPMPLTIGSATFQNIVHSKFAELSQSICQNQRIPIISEQSTLCN